MTILRTIRRLHFRDNLSIREISRRTGLSRTTVRKWLSGEAVETPVFKRRGNITTKLAPFADQLRQWVQTDAQRPKKHRRTVTLMCNEIAAQGYTGGYSQVAAFVAALRQQNARKSQCYIPMAFEPGDAMQFDWSTEDVLMRGKRERVQVAHSKLCYSRAFALAAYPKQTHEMLFDAHNLAFRLFGGVPKRGIYDNMSTAVDAVHSGKSRSVNKRFEAMLAHNLMEATFCNRAAGWEKGIVEKNVQDRRRQIFHANRDRDWNGFDELNEYLEAECRRQWSYMLHPTQRERTIANVLAEEQASLLRVERQFDGYVEIVARVSTESLIAVDTHFYSVPCPYVHQHVTIRAYPFEIVVTIGGHSVCRHARCHDGIKGRVRYDWLHYLPALQRKPGAIRDGAPFKDIPRPMRKLSQLFSRELDGDRWTVEVLSAVPRLGVQAVCHAVEKALSRGYPSIEQLREDLRQLTDQQAPTVDPSLFLTQSVPAVANVQRYETLVSPESDVEAAMETSDEC